MVDGVLNPSDQPYVVAALNNVLQRNGSSNNHCSHNNGLNNGLNNSLVFFKHVYFCNAILTFLDLSCSPL